MSLLICYHDAKRAAVASDDRAIVFGDSGQVIPLIEQVPKFIICGALLFAAVGQSDVCGRLNGGITRLVAENPTMSSVQLANLMPGILRHTWKTKRADENMPALYNNLECAVLGFDPIARKMRSFVFVKGSDFEAVETTASPANKIFALGSYGPGDLGTLERLTAMMQHAHRKGTPWIASQLKNAVNEIHRRSPLVVGEASYFAAIDDRGVVELPENFPPAPSHIPELATAAASHRAVTTKETAFAGTWRFFVGSIITPQAGGVDTIGNSDGGGGAQNGMMNELFMSIAQTTGTSGTGATCPNPQLAIDGSTTTSAQLTATGNGSTNLVVLTLAGPAGFNRKFLSVTLKILFSVPTNNLAPAGSLHSVIISYSLDGGGSFTTAYTLTPPTTQALLLVAIPLSGTQNLSQVQVKSIAGNNALWTSGQVIMNLFEGWIEAIE